MSSRPTDLEITPTFASQKVSYTASGTPYLNLFLPSSISPVYLTPFHTTDTDPLQAILSNPAISNNLDTVPQPYTPADASSWVTLQLSKSPSSSLPLQVIRAHSPDADGTFIGCTSLASLSSPILGSLAINSDAEENEYEVGYYLHPEWQGKGIMSAAVRAAVAWAKEEYDANAVTRIAEVNLASRRVVERMGEWERVENRDRVVEWPEVKGGGSRKLLFWKWKY